MLPNREIQTHFNGISQHSRKYDVKANRRTQLLIHSRGKKRSNKVEPCIWGIIFRFNVHAVLKKKHTWSCVIWKYPFWHDLHQHSIALVQVHMLMWKREHPWQERGGDHDFPKSHQDFDSLLSNQDILGSTAVEEIPAWEPWQPMQCHRKKLKGQH